MSYGSTPPPQYVPPYSPGALPPRAPYGPPGNPYLPPGYVAPPPSTGWSCGTIGLVVIGVLAVVCCGGAGGLFYLGMQQQHRKAETAVMFHPVVQQHLGTVRTTTVVSWNLSGGKETDYVIELVGDRGAGRATFRYHDDDGILEGDLQLADGTEVPLRVGLP
jgi:hypothetical protein